MSEKPTEHEKFFDDMLLYGVGITKDGRRVPPREVRIVEDSEATDNQAASSGSVIRPSPTS